MAALDFLRQHGYLVLFLLVLAERIGLPLPALPILVGAGALVRAGSMSPSAAVVLAVSACLLADILWFRVGRSRGGRVMSWLCRISLEPDSCVRRTERVFSRFGARSLVVAKFLPPLSLAAVPMAGMLGMSPVRFLVFDTLGSALWVLTFMSLGYAFHDQLALLLEHLGWMGAWLGLILVAALIAYVLIKWLRRRRFLRDLRIARITPEELWAKLDSGEDVAVVDLRHSLEFAGDPATIPGALHIPVEELPRRHGELPRGREIVLYCT